MAQKQLQLPHDKKPTQSKKQPRNKTRQPASTRHYNKVNAYSHRASVEQIITIILFLVQFAMHCVFVIRPIFCIDHPALYIMWILGYLLIVFMSIDYFIITCGDPVDLLIVDEVELVRERQKHTEFQRSNGEGENPHKMRYCAQCVRTVKWSSYHCWRCGRCVEGMDHHCKYLNNCIGDRNYTAFFRMLLTTTAYLLISIGEGIWIFVVASRNTEVNLCAFSRWAVLVFIILTVLLVLAVDSLLFFHCYISCCRHMTTIEYLFRDTPSNQSGTPAQQSGNRLQDQVVDQIPPK